MQLPRLLESLITINFNFSDNRKIEIFSGKKNRGKVVISDFKKDSEDKPDETSSKLLSNSKDSKEN